MTEYALSPQSHQPRPFSPSRQTTESKSSQTMTNAIRTFPVSSLSLPIACGRRTPSKTRTTQTEEHGGVIPSSMNNNNSWTLPLDLAIPFRLLDLEDYEPWSTGDSAVPPLGCEGVSVSSESVAGRTVATNTSHIGWRSPTQCAGRRSTWQKAVILKKSLRRSHAATQTD